MIRGKPKGRFIYKGVESSQRPHTTDPKLPKYLAFRNQPLPPIEHDTKTMLVEAFQDLWAWSLSSPLNAAVSAVGFGILLVVLSYFSRPALVSIPGPFIAKFSDLWLVRQAMRGNRYEVVDDLHKKHGKFVRIAPNHVSINDPSALQPVYGHSTGTLKADFYDAFAAPTLPRGLFNTRSRPEHSRKRKIVSHVFAPKSIGAFEPFVRREIQALLGRFEELSSKDPSGWAELDMLMWMNYFAFDTIGSLAFGSVFGMIEQGKPDAVVELPQPDGSIHRTSCDAVRIINERGEYSATMGVLPPYLRPWAAKLPWFSERLLSVRKLSGIALARVNDRLKNGSEREDLLAKLQTGTDEKGEMMGKDELVAEALTQLIAGSDTTSNTATAVLHLVCSHPNVYKKLRAELDENLVNDGEEVPLSADVKDLPYLNAVISETLRVHSTSAIGLPRLIPEGGCTFEGKHFPEGTVLSVPTYSIHRNREVWGDDAEEFRPERWLVDEQKRAQYDRVFNVFSTGSRQCVGKNLGILEQQLLVAAMFKKMDFELVDPKAPLETIEGFLRKPVTLPMRVRKRRSE